MMTASAPNQDNFLSRIAMMPDAALKQIAQMYQSDPYILPMVVSEGTRRQKMRAAQQGIAGMQPQPTVKDQAVASLQSLGAPQQPPQAQPGPETSGIGALATPNIQRMAGGGIAGYAEGDVVMQAAKADGSPEVIAAATKEDNSPEALRRAALARAIQDVAGVEREIALSAKTPDTAPGQKDRMFALNTELKKLRQHVAELSSAPIGAAAAAKTPPKSEGFSFPSVSDLGDWRAAPAAAAVAAAGLKKAGSAGISALNRLLTSGGIPEVTGKEVASQVGRDVKGAVQKVIPKGPVSGLARLGVAGALAGTAAQTATTDTDRYRQRFGMETGKNEDPSFFGDITARALGAASDLGDAATFGWFGDKFFRDRQPNAKPSTGNPLMDTVVPVVDKGIAALRGTPGTTPAAKPKLGQRTVGLDMDTEQAAPASADAKVPPQGSKEDFRRQELIDQKTQTPGRDDIIEAAKEATPPSKKTQRFTNDDWLNFGLAMLASRNPRFLGALGESGIKTIAAKQEREKQEREEARGGADVDLKKAQAEHYRAQARTAGKPAAVPAEIALTERYMADPAFRKAYEQMMQGKRDPQTMEALMKTWSNDFMLQKKYPNVQDFIATMMAQGGADAATRTGSSKLKYNPATGKIE